MNPDYTSPNAKQTARQAMLARLRDTSAEQRSAWSSAIVKWLTLSDAWIGHGGIVALFGGLKLEADLLSVIPWLRVRGFHPALFAIEPDRTMIPYLVNRETDLVPGPLGALEPNRAPEARVKIEDLGTVLVPGRAFSSVDGTRLGLGKGHYDRLLSAPGFRARKIGVGFALQMIPSVPSESHDVKMDALVNESGWTGVTKTDMSAPLEPTEERADQLSKYLLELFR